MNSTLRNNGRKVLLIELNEITWRFVDPLLKKGVLPTFARFIETGVRGSPVATEDANNLDPWISWTSLYTGRRQEQHGVRFLEQPPETVTGPRIWELVADAGKSIGVFGSIMSWPPRKGVKGFWVPSTFSPNGETCPAELQPIQELNLSATRAHSPLASEQKVTRLGLVRALKKLGLRWSTLGRIAAFFVRTRLRPHRKWEKVCLQPLVNLDFFERLYRTHRPDFATFHSNHVAHYQHRYWRAADPTPFFTEPSDEELRKYGAAVEYSYRVADEVLARLWALADKDTVVIVASGLGQQPYVVEEFKEGRQVVRIRDIHQIIGLCGITGYCTPLSMMAPQWNLTIPDAAKRAQAEHVLSTAWYREPGVRLFAFTTVGDTINVNVFQKNLKPLDLDALCGFPDAGEKTFRLGEICAAQDPTPKQGYHDPVGFVAMNGPGIRAGGTLEDCTNLDFAPSILSLLGLPAPDYMQGRVLNEALTPTVSMAEAQRPSRLEAVAH
ncbi:MAG: alkaline phosphatase family protein [Pirellulales bacterium]